MTAVLKIDVRHLFPYVRVTPGDGFDPADNDFLQPQFADAAAGEGNPLISTHAGNRELAWPVHLKALPSARTNLVSNPKLDNDATGITTVGAGTLTRVALDGSSGPVPADTPALYAYKLIGVASGNRGCWTIPVVNGVTYRFSVFAYLEAGSGPITTLVEDATPTVVGSGSTFSTTGQWARLDLSFTATATANWRVSVRQLNASNATFYATCALVEATSDLLGYHDGDQAGGRWDGTPGSSTSSSYVGKDGLHQLVRDVNRDLAAAVLAEWRDDSASRSTFFDVAFARFEPDYNYRRGQKLYVSGVIRVFTGPYGHTATSRIVGTIATGGPAVVVSVPSALDGDAPALAVGRLTAGSAPVLGGRVVGMSVLPHASYAVRIPAGSLVDLSGAATVVGASGAAGSQFLRVMHDTLSYRAFSVPLAIPSVYAGKRHRLLAVAKSLAEDGYSLNVIDDAGEANPTAAATAFRDWQLVDLGVIAVPSVAPSGMRIPVHVGRNRVSISHLRGLPSAYLGVNEILMVPEDSSALLMDSNRARALGADDFGSGDSTVTVAQLVGQGDMLGNTWGAVPLVSATTLMDGDIYGLSIASAVGAADGAAILNHTAVKDLRGFARFEIPGAPNANLVKIQAGKLGGAFTAGVYGEVGWASAAYLAIRTQLLSASTVASVGIAPSSLLASTCYELDFQSKASQFSVGVRCAVSSAPVVNAAGSAFERLELTGGLIDSAQAGQLVIGISQPSLGAARPHIRAAHAFEAPAPSIARPFDTYTLDEVNGLTYRAATGGDITAQLADTLRGGLPQVQPSTPAVAFIEAPVDPGFTADTMSVELRVRERFAYGR